MIKFTFFLFSTVLFCAACVHTAPSNELTVSEVVPGIFVHQGVQEESSAANEGAIANIGFIVGKKCVAVIDTGGTLAVGKKLRAAILKTTSTPICYVINTHMHPDHIFGNGAFVEDKPAFIGHGKLATAVASRAQNYLNAMKRDLGTVADGSIVVPPTQSVSDTLDLDLGGRILKLRAWRTAHTDNDLTVFDETTQTLWLSDLLFIGHAPALDGKLIGWLAVMDALRAMKPALVIPGHGAPSKQWPSASDAQKRYLDSLLQETRLMIRDKKTIQQAIDSVGKSEQDKWLLFDSFHRRNVAAAYAELEWEE